MGRADIHSHTYYSGFNRVGFVPFPESVTSPSEMVLAAERSSFDVLCVTDHNSIAGATRAQSFASDNRLRVSVVVGEEITTVDGEVLGLFVTEHVPRGLSAAETVDLIHSQGGLAVAPHPFSYQCPSLGYRISTLRLDGVEVLNAGHRDGYVNRIAMLQCREDHARLGSSDAHTKLTIGNAWTEFDGSTPEELYKSIILRHTEAGGSANGLSDYIGWSVEVAQEVSRKILTKKAKREHDDPLGRICQMRRHNKALALVGSAIYSTTPLPLVAGVLGEGLVRRRGRRMWHEVMSPSSIDGTSWITQLWRQLVR
jgi:hypothetical protein